MEKYIILYLGKETEVVGNFHIYENEHDFCCQTVKVDNRYITYKLDSPEFTAIEGLVLIERSKGIVLNK
tara:strand:- start:5523 stop:5729 length:207 start_codon:yes stop_codon:yes gene_type:complete